MNVQVFTLCHRYIQRDNSIDILGMFHHVWRNKVPYEIDGDILAMRLNFTAGVDAEGLRKFIIALRDEREFIVETNQDSFDVDYDGFPYVTYDIGYELKKIYLPKFGNYSFHLYIDGKAVAHTHLAFLSS
jgi:hypothetical protein